MYKIIIFINTNLNLETMNVFKLAIYGGAAYLAYNYLKKRKANKAALETIAVSSSANELESVEEDMVAAELQEVGEEGMAITTEGQGELTKLAEEDLQGADGWDSDNLTSGI